MKLRCNSPLPETRLTDLGATWVIEEEDTKLYRQWRRRGTASSAQADIWKTVHELCKGLAMSDHKDLRRGAGSCSLPDPQDKTMMNAFCGRNSNGKSCTAFTESLLIVFKKFLMEVLHFADTNISEYFVGCFISSNIMCSILYNSLI